MFNITSTTYIYLFIIYTNNNNNKTHTQNGNDTRSSDLPDTSIIDQQSVSLIRSLYLSISLNLSHVVVVSHFYYFSPFQNSFSASTLSLSLVSDRRGLFRLATSKSKTRSYCDTSKEFKSSATRT